MERISVAIAATAGMVSSSMTPALFRIRSVRLAPRKNIIFPCAIVVSSTSSFAAAAAAQLCSSNVVQNAVKLS
jgi:hypothetical protein